MTYFRHLCDRAFYNLFAVQRASHKRANISKRLTVINNNMSNQVYDGAA